MDGVPINRAAWSASSRRCGGHYDARATEYEGISCRCRACGLAFVCTAAEQRDAYEVQKRHVWWLPARCQICSSKLAAFRERDRFHQARWEEDRASASTDLAFVRGWLEIIREMYALGFENPLGPHLERLLSDSESEGPRSCG